MDPSDPLTDDPGSRRVIPDFHIRVPIFDVGSGWSNVGLLTPTAGGRGFLTRGVVLSSNKGRQK